MRFNPNAVSCREVETLTNGVAEYLNVVIRLRVAVQGGCAVRILPSRLSLLPEIVANDVRSGIGIVVSVELASTTSTWLKRRGNLFDSG